MHLQVEEQGQAPLLEEHSARRRWALWPMGRLRLACCLALAAALGAVLSTLCSPVYRAAGGPPGAGEAHARGGSPGEGGPRTRDSDAAAAVPRELPALAPPAPSGPPAGGEESLRPSIEALVQRSIMEALSGGVKKFVSMPGAQASTSYTRQCSIVSINRGAICSPPACSGDHGDLGVDCLYTGTHVCTRTCLVLSRAAEFLPADADGHPIVCGSDFAAVGPAMPPRLFNGSERSVEFVADTTGFVIVDLWGGGGGGTGAVKAASSDHELILEVGIEGDTTYSGIYELKGATASGARWYQICAQMMQCYVRPTYLYYDPDCSNRGFGEAWFFSDSAPDTSRRVSLDPNNRNRADNRCSCRLTKPGGRNGVPMGRQIWVYNNQEVTVSIKFSSTESWVCGAGGGGAAHVRALVELRAGQTYRFEVGPGGAGGSAGKAAQNGQATRLLQRTEMLDWRVLAEAGGGFGAGDYNAAFLYSPGGQGGFTSPHRSHLETRSGRVGHASRGDLTGPSEILPPDLLLGAHEIVCNGTSSCAGFDTSNGNMGISINGQYFSSMSARRGVRQPCGDITPPRAGCSSLSAPDWFLTCSSSFRLGSRSDTSLMQCHGIAAVHNADDGPGEYWPHRGPLTSGALVGGSWAAVGPPGGFAVTGQGAAASLGAGDGGMGMCPVMQKPPGKLRAVVKGVAGEAGSMGAAMLSHCRRRGAYVLALQRCREGPGGRALRSTAGASGWTLHGLWPEGSQGCRGDAFDLPALRDLQPRLRASWPSCPGGETAEEFWRWEWEKHGRCFGADQRRYFQLSLELRERHAAACAEWRTDDCRLCLTADFQLCAGLSDAPASAGGS